MQFVLSLRIDSDPAGSSKRIPSCCNSQPDLYTVSSIAGVGFVGRHLTTYLIKEGLVSKIRVVDKVPPATGWLNAQHKV